MRAWRVASNGEPTDVLALEHDVAEPVAAGDQVVIEVGACALNFADSLLCRGTYQERPPLPFTPGLEVAGVVRSAGPDAPHAVGDRVTGSPLLPHGGLAELALAAGSHVFASPAGVDDTALAALHVTYQTAWFALHRRAAVQPGETVLVHAGAGGMGSASIQLAAAAGATVIATAGGPDKVERCLALGADHGIDYRNEDFVAVVNDLTGGRGADVILDSVGGDTFVGSTRCIAWEGRIVVVGAAGGRYAEARTNHAMVKDYSILGLNWRGYLVRRPELVADAQAALGDLLAAGTIAPLVSDVLALDDDIPAAIGRVTGGATVGKLVVVP
jgi:NADPH2:quinone reductase